MMAGKSKGWIRLDRSIRDNWLWGSERHSKQSAWIDLLLRANHEDRPIMIGTRRIIVHRGQIWTSYKKLKEAWQWSNDRFYGFLNQLISDQMIAVNPTKTGTLITVLNYSKYQGFEHDNPEEPEHISEHKSERRSEHKPERKPDTNNNVNNVYNNNVNKRTGPGAGERE